MTGPEHSGIGDVAQAATKVGDAASAVGDAADAVGQVAPVLAGATDKIGSMAGTVSAAGGAIGDAAGGLDRAVDSMPTMSPEIRRQRLAALGPQMAEVAAARAGMFDSLERLEASGYAALDVPSSVRRHPARIAGLAAGTGFLALDGPGRTWRAIRGRLIPTRVSAPLPPGLTRALGGDDEAVSDLATLLAAGRPPRRRGRLAGLLSGTIFLPLGLRWGRDLASTLLETDQATFDRRLRLVHARNAARAARAGSPPSPAAGAPESAPAAPRAPETPAQG